MKRASRKKPATQAVTTLSKEGRSTKVNSWENIKKKHSSPRFLTLGGFVLFLIAILISVNVNSQNPDASNEFAFAGLFVVFAFVYWGSAIICMLMRLYRKQVTSPSTSARKIEVSSKNNINRRGSLSLLSRHPKLTILGVILIIAVAWQPIADHLTISQADPNMIELSQKAGMSHKGELVFLRTHPKLDSDEQILKDCGSLGSSFNSNGVILQGCYDPTTHRIYIRQMTGDYADLEITTAAYEALHPIYMSIASSDQAALNKAIEAEYTSRSGDADLSGQIELFAKTEPGARDNELFSIFGTQYSGLSGALASYYAPYFDNLAVDVAINQRLQGLIPDLRSRMNTLNDKINQDDTYANTAYANSVSWARYGNAYETNRNYNIYLQDLNIENRDIASFNQLVDQLNALITEFTGSQPVSQKQSIQSQSQ